MSDTEPPPRRVPQSPPGVRNLKETLLRPGFVRRALWTGGTSGAALMALAFGIGSALNNLEPGLPHPVGVGLGGAAIGAAVGGAGGLLAGALAAVTVRLTAAASVLVTTLAVALAVASVPFVVLVLVLGPTDGTAAATRWPFIGAAVIAAGVAAAFSRYIRSGGVTAGSAPSVASERSEQGQARP